MNISFGLKRRGHDGDTRPDHVAANLGTPVHLDSSIRGEYDAWNRLVEVTDGGVLVTKFRYDGEGAGFYGQSVEVFGCAKRTAAGKALPGGRSHEFGFERWVGFGQLDKGSDIGLYRLIGESFFRFELR